MLPDSVIASSLELPGASFRECSICCPRQRASFMQVLHINPQKKDIDSFVFEDFTLEGYTPHKQIAMKMAV